MFILNPNKRKQTVKEAIMIILSSKWPLRTNQIHNHLRTNLKIKTSYQSVHKSLLELHKEDLLIKTENGWQLSSEWIENMHNFFHRTKDSYKGTLIFDPLTMGSDITTLNFKTLVDLDDFYFDLFENSIKNSLKKRMVFCLKHNWRPLLYSHKERDFLKKSLKQHYFIIGGNTFLDKWCSNFETKSGAKVKIGSNYMTSCDLYIIGDMIIQIYFPKDIIEKINSIFMYSKKGNLDMGKIIQDIFEKKSKIVVIINKNEELAKQMRHQAVELFNEKSK